MPLQLEISHAATDAPEDFGPFTDLVAQIPAPATQQAGAEVLANQLIGGGTADAPAFQVVDGKTSNVPIGAPVSSTQYGPFSDLVSEQALPPVDDYGREFGMFADMVPKSQVPETEKALGETPTPKSFLDTLKQDFTDFVPAMKQLGEQLDETGIKIPRLYHSILGDAVIKAIPGGDVALSMARRFAPQQTFEDVSAVGGTAANTVSSLTNAKNVAMLAAFAGAPEFVGTAVGLGFSAQAAQDMFEKSKQIAGETDPIKRKTLLGDMVTDGAFVTLGAAGAVSKLADLRGSPTAPPIQETPVSPAIASERPPATLERRLPVTQEESPQSAEAKPISTTAQPAQEGGETNPSQGASVRVEGNIYSGATQEAALDAARADLAPEMTRERFVEVARQTDPSFALDATTAEPYDAATDVQPGQQDAGVSGESASERQTGERGSAAPLQTAPTEEAGRTAKSRLANRSPDEFGTELTPVAAHIINDVGGLMSKSTAIKRGLYKGNEELWDGAPKLSHPSHNKIYNERGVMPDEAVQSLYDAGLIKEDSVDAMWRALGSDSHTAQTVVKEQRIQASAERELLQNLGAAESPTIKERASDAIEGLTKAAREAAQESQKQGLLPPGSQHIQNAAETVAAVVKQIRGVPKFGDFEQVINQFGRKMQTSHLDSGALERQIKKVVPNKLKREAVFTYMDAGGDQTKLAAWAAKADPRKFPEYKAALKLTPEQTKLADFLTTFFDKKGAEGQAAGVLRDLRDDYIARLVDKRSTARAGGSGNVGGVGLPGGRLSKTFKFAKERVFDSAFEAEQKGVRYLTKDPAALVPIYLNEMNKTIGSRELITELVQGKAADSRALAYPMGLARPVLDAEGVREATIIKPNFKQRVTDEISGEDVSSHDYVPSQHPALTKYKWLDTDAEGKPVLMEGNLALHPDIARHVNNIFGSSAIRRWYNGEGSALASLPKGVVRTLDHMNQTAKMFLFSGSGFHHVTMAKKGFDVGAHPIRNFFKTLPANAALDPRDPKVTFWMEHGSQLAPDYLSASRFMEGFSGRGVEGLPVYGPYVRALSSHLFERFIPAMKMTLDESYLARNRKLFAKELASNEVTEEQLAYLSARQANEALSHINYLDIGRNPTLQHIFSILELAPDFLESRTRFTVRAIGGGVTGGKSGRLALKGFVWGMAHTWVAARILNKLVDDDYHFDQPFGIQHNGRVYSLRTVYGDMLQLMGGIYHAAQGDLSGLSNFMQSRESPIAKLSQMLLTGVNYRGEKTNSIEAMREFIGNYIPIWAKSLPGLRELTESTRQNPVSPLEQFSGAWGFRSSRYSPISKTYALASEYKKAAGIPKDTGTYPVSKYQQLRYALEDGDLDKAQAEYQKLKASGELRSKIAQGFHESIMHPFTGSEKEDAKFKKSLAPEERALYEAAVKRRHEILRLFGRMPKSLD